MPEGEGQQQAVGGVDRMALSCKAVQRLGPARSSRAIGRARRAVAEPGAEQHERRDGDGGQLDPVLHGLHEGDRAHAAGGDVGHHDDGDDQAADPGRRPGDGRQGQPGALQLGQEVEPADADHEHRAEPADRRCSRAAPRRSRAACRRPTGAAVRRRGRAARRSRRCSRRGTTACRGRWCRPARRCRESLRRRGTRRRWRWRCGTA